MSLTRLRAAVGWFAVLAAPIAAAAGVAQRSWTTAVAAYTVALTAMVALYALLIAIAQWWRNHADEEPR